MSSAAARSGTAAKGFVGARWWGKPRGEPNVGITSGRHWLSYERTEAAGTATSAQM